MWENCRRRSLASLITTDLSISLWRLPKYCLFRRTWLLSLEMRLLNCASAGCAKWLTFPRARWRKFRSGASRSDMRIRDSSATMSQRCGGCPMASTALCHERSMGRERSHCHSQIERRTSCRPQGRYRKDRHFTADGKVRCVAYLDRIDRYRHELVAGLSGAFWAFMVARIGRAHVLTPVTNGPHVCD